MSTGASSAICRGPLLGEGCSRVREALVAVVHKRAVKSRAQRTSIAAMAARAVAGRRLLPAEPQGRHSTSVIGSRSAGRGSSTAGWQEVAGGCLIHTVGRHAAALCKTATPRRTAETAADCTTRTCSLRNRDGARLNRLTGLVDCCLAGQLFQSSRHGGSHCTLHVGASKCSNLHAASRPALPTPPPWRYTVHTTLTQADPCWNRCCKVVANDHVGAGETQKSERGDRADVRAWTDPALFCRDGGGEAKPSVAGRRLCARAG